VNDVFTCASTTATLLSRSTAAAAVTHVWAPISLPWCGWGRRARCFVSRCREKEAGVILKRACSCAYAARQKGWLVQPPNPFLPKLPRPSIRGGLLQPRQAHTAPVQPTMNFAQSIAKPQDGSETPLRAVQIDGQVSWGERKKKSLRDFYTQKNAVCSIPPTSLANPRASIFPLSLAVSRSHTHTIPPPTL
jgi:hypothetical protein